VTGNLAVLNEHTPGAGLTGLLGAIMASLTRAESVAAARSRQISRSPVRGRQSIPTTVLLWPFTSRNIHSGILRSSQPRQGDSSPIR